MTMKQSRRKLARNFYLLGLVEVLGNLRLYNPITFLYFAQMTGSYTLGMAVFSFATITTAVMEIPTGILSDKWKRKNLGPVDIQDSQIRLDVIH